MKDSNPKAVLFLFLLFSIPAHLSFAQISPGGTKTYSGYLHQYSKNKTSFWHTFFGGKSPQQEQVLEDRQCLVEFKSPTSFFNRSVVVLPEQLSYFIRFKNGLRFSKVNPVKEKDAFEKIIIKIYTNDDEEYSIDPESEGRQLGLNQEHHIFDSYLIYLILGTSINHLEIVNPSGNNFGKYVLDKLVIRDNH